MTGTCQPPFRPGSIDPMVCRDHASQIRSRELAMMARRLLRALRQLAPSLRSRMA